MARDRQPLDARRRAGLKRDIARWDAGGMGQQGDQRSIRLAFDRGGADSCLEYALPIGALLDAVDGVTPPRGVSRTKTESPPAATVHGRGGGMAAK